MFDMNPQDDEPADKTAYALYEAEKLIATQSDIIDKMTADHLAAMAELQAKLDAVRAEVRELRQFRIGQGCHFPTPTMEATNAALRGEP